MIDCTNYIYQYRFFEKLQRATWKMKLFQTVIAFIPPWNEMKFKLAYDRYIRKYNDRQTENLVYLSNRKYMRKLIPRTCFDRVEFMEFEGEQFPVPGDWQEVLLRLYGKNYMDLPPLEQRVTVHGSAVIDTENSWRAYKQGANGYEKV